MNSEIYPGEERAPVMYIGRGCRSGRRRQTSAAPYTSSHVFYLFTKNPKVYPDSKLPILSCLIWAETDQIACGNLCLEQKVNENHERGSEERLLWFWTEYKKHVIASDSCTMASLKSLRTASAKLSLLTLRRSLRSAIVGEAHPIPWRQRIL